MTPLDPATVQRCIEALKGTGRYDKQWKRLSDMGDPDLIESWTYTTHPMDILADLLKPKPTEAEKLVDEWKVEAGYSSSFGDFDIDDMLELTQFILDKQAQNATMNFATALHDQRVYEEPIGATQFVYGPWIIHPDGNAPVIPEGWKYQLRGCTTGRVHNEILTGPDTAQTWSATDYRIRFEVGKWYDWAGGPCPVDDAVTVEVIQRDEYQCSGPARDFTLAGWESGGCWKRTTIRDDHIVRFRVLAP